MINIKNLSFGYGKYTLFSNLNLTLEPGAISGLLGKNGAGKTTLLRLIAGLLFSRSGEIEIMGHDPAGRSPDFLQDIFLLPEEIGLPNVTPDQYAMLYASFYPEFNYEQYGHYLNEFELEKKRKFNSYSYGQKKKFLIAFGLATGSRLMLLDEPTNGLDIPSKTQFRRALAAEASEDRTIIISTHQVRDLETLIDPVIILDQGRIIFNHSMEDVTSRLKVETQGSSPDPETALFSERTLDGYMVVKENLNGETSNLNLEMLFNTVMNNRKRISRIFQGGYEK